MSEVLQGAVLTRIYSDLVLDPKYGPSTREVWQGKRSSLLALSAAYSAAGFRVEYSDNEGIGQLTVTLPQGNDPTQTETPSDTWEIITEMDQQSVWNNKRVFQQASLDPLGAIAAIAYWRQKIQNALVGKYALAGTGEPLQYAEFNPDSREPLTPAQAGISATLHPFLYKMYAKFLRGEESFEFRRTTLRLSRVVTSNYAGRAVVDPIEKIYTTAKLKSTFTVPDSVFRLLPINPAGTIPDNTAWSWKLRQDGYQIVLSTNKVQETKDWIFAAWDTDIYELVS